MMVLVRTDWLPPEPSSPGGPGLEELEAAFRAHAPVLRRHALHIVRDGFMAEEVVQDVFLRLATGASRFDPERASLRSFLLMDCHGRAVDLVRAESTRRAREQRNLVQASKHEHPEISTDVLDALLAGALGAAMETLPAGEREAIMLAFFGPCSYREVARRLDVPEGTVKSRIRAGLLRLRPFLDSQGYGTSD